MVSERRQEKNNLVKKGGRIAKTAQPSNGLAKPYGVGSLNMVDGVDPTIVCRLKPGRLASGGEDRDLNTQSCCHAFHSQAVTRGVRPRNPGQSVKPWSEEDPQYKRDFLRVDRKNKLNQLKGARRS